MNDNVSEGVDFCPQSARALTPRTVTLALNGLFDDSSFRGTVRRVSSHTPSMQLVVSELSHFSMEPSENAVRKTLKAQGVFPCEAFTPKDNPTRAWFQRHVLLLPVIRLQGQGH
jgi:hypothetical protein